MKIYVRASAGEHEEIKRIKSYWKKNYSSVLPDAISLNLSKLDDNTLSCMSYILSNWQYIKNIPEHSMEEILQLWSENPNGNSAYPYSDALLLIAKNPQLSVDEAISSITKKNNDSSQRTYNKAIKFLKAYLVDIYADQFNIPEKDYDKVIDRWMKAVREVDPDLYTVKYWGKDYKELWDSGIINEDTYDLLEQDNFPHYLINEIIEN